MKPQPPVTRMRIDLNSVQFPSVEWTGLRSVAAKRICSRLQSVRQNDLGALDQKTRPRRDPPGATRPGPLSGELMLDATHVKAHRSAAGGKGGLELSGGALARWVHQQNPWLGRWLWLTGCVRPDNGQRRRHRHGAASAAGRRATPAPDRRQGLRCTEPEGLGTGIASASGPNLKGVITSGPTTSSKPARTRNASSGC